MIGSYMPVLLSRQKVHSNIDCKIPHLLAILQVKSAKCSFPRIKYGCWIENILVFIFCLVFHHNDSLSVHKNYSHFWSHMNLWICPFWPFRYVLCPMFSLPVDEFQLELSPLPLMTLESAHMSLMWSIAWGCSVAPIAAEVCVHVRAYVRMM